jgi:AraC-like DNA-binding protein
MEPSGRYEELRGSATDLDSWRNLIKGSEPPFQRIETVQDGGEFNGKLSRQILDGISAHLVEIKATRHIQRRTEEHTRDSHIPLYIIMFQLQGNSIFTQAGSRAELKPGDFAVSTSTVPYEWEFTGDFSVFMLRFPQASIDAPSQSLLPLTGRVITPKSIFGKQLSAFVEGIAREPDLLRGTVGRRIAQNLVDLFTTSFISELEGAGGLSLDIKMPLFQKITEFISENLGNPELDVPMIAHANFVSIRQLQSIFHDHGTTVTSWIRERRLSHCRRDLGNSVLNAESIAEISRRWGIADQAYFSRIFRQAFGESPKQWRLRSTRVLERS